MKTSLIALTAALAITSPAIAQTRDAPSWTSETIVVTGKREGYAAPDTTAATRTDTPLIQVPQSVQVLTRTLIQEQDRRTLGDALANVSGVTPTRSDEVLFIPPIVRGFPAEVYLDGLPVFAGNQQAYDPNSLVGIERIDVLKGPTATLYGGGLGTPLGELVFHVFGAIAHFERRLISERTRDGIAAARARGKVPGRPTLDTDKLVSALKLVEAGIRPAQAAKQLGLGRSTLYRELALLRELAPETPALD